MTCYSDRQAIVAAPKKRTRRVDVRSQVRCSFEAGWRLGITRLACVAIEVSTPSIGDTGTDPVAHVLGRPRDYDPLTCGKRGGTEGPGKPPALPLSFPSPILPTGGRALLAPMMLSFDAVFSELEAFEWHPARHPVRGGSERFMSGPRDRKPRLG